MSIADCFKKLNIDPRIQKEINKDIKKLVKKGSSLEDAQLQAIEKVIEQSKDELESVREKLPGDLAPVEFQVSSEEQGKYKVTNKDGSVFNQSQAGLKSGESNQTKFALPENVKRFNVKNESDISKYLNRSAQLKTDVQTVMGGDSVTFETATSGLSIQIDAASLNNTIDNIFKTYDSLSGDRPKKAKVVLEKSIHAIGKLKQILSSAVYLYDKNGNPLLYSVGNINGKEAVIKIELNKKGETYGLSGISYENTNDQDTALSTKPKADGADSLGDISIAQFKDSVNKARGNRLLFQENQGNPNASYQKRADGANIIRIYKSANQSSFIHESGHLFIQGLFDRVMSGDGTSKELKQWKVAAEWLKYDPENQTELSVDQHEQFARGFEAYLREGKAPVKGLAQTFNYFRKWLTKIYKSAKSLNVEMTPEIVSLMDSMVATEDQISQAKMESGQAMASTEEVMGDQLTPAVKEKLQSLKDNADRIAFEKLFKEQMKLQGEEHKQFLEEQRKEFLKKFTEEVNASPEAQAVRAQKEALKVKDLKGLALKVLNNSFDEDKMFDLEMDAERLGYSSLDHMAKELIEQQTIEAMIKEKVDQAMDDIAAESAPAAMREKATRAIRNERSVELMALEKELLFKMASEENEKELEKIADAMAKDDIKLIQQWMIAKEVHKVTGIFNGKLEKQSEQFKKEITRLEGRASEINQKNKQKDLARKWLEAKDDNERRKAESDFRESIKGLKKVLSGNSSNEASRIKDIAREMLAKKSYKEASQFSKYFTAERNSALRVATAIRNNDYDAALKAKHEQLLNHALAKESIRIKRRSDAQVKFLNKMKGLRKDLWKNEDHLFQASKILERFGYERRDFEQNPEGMSLVAYIADQTEKGAAINISDWISNEGIRLDQKAITVEQLEDIANAVKNIRTIANQENKFHLLAKKGEIDAKVLRLTEEARLNVKPGARFKHKFTDSRIDKLKGWGRGYMFSLKKIDTAIGPMTAWRDNSEWGEVLKDSVHDQADVESIMIQEATKNLEQNWSIYTNKERSDIYNKKIYIDELNISVTKESILAMMHNLGNDGNRARLFESRPVGIDESIAWNEAVVMDLLQKYATKKDWTFVQSNWNLLESYWPKIAKLHKELTGFTPGKVKHSAFTIISEGEAVELQGGYYPLKGDARASLAAEIKSQADAPLYTDQNPAWRATTKTGHTKERTNAQYPVSLTLGILNRHMQDVIHDLAFRPLVMDLSRLIARPDIQAVLKESISPEGLKNIHGYVQSLGNAAAGEAVTEIDKAVKVARKHVVKSVLLFKVSVITQNFANALIFPNAVEGFGYADAFKSYLKYGIADYAMSMLTNKGKVIREEVYALSPFMKDRADSPDYSIEEVHNKFSQHEAGAISKFGGGLMAFTDEFTNIPMWKGAFNKALGEGKTQTQAIKIADTLIERVAGSSRKYDVAAISRGSELTKMFSMFFSWINTEHNRWMREKGIFDRDKDYARALGFLAGRIVFQVAGAALMFKLPDWEEEDEVKKFIFANTAGLPLAFFPGFRDVFAVMADQAMGVRGFGYNPSPVISSVKDFTDFTGEAINQAKGKGDTEKLIRKGSKVASLALGYPDQFNQWFDNLYRYGADGMTPEIEDAYRRRPAKER